jgi:diguanylate cyclase (GGDEF)-like protein
MDHDLVAPNIEYDKLVQDCLRVMARFTHARQAHLLFLTCNQRYSKDFYSWAENPNSEDESHGASPLRLDSSWWLRALRIKNVLKIDSIASLPDIVAEDRQRLLSQGVHTLTLLPVYNGKRLIGTVRIENPTNMREYTNPELDLLQIAAQLIVQVLCISYDIADLKHDQARLVYQNSHDAHTGLPTHTEFLKHIQDATQFENRSFAILLVNFKYYQLIHEHFGAENSRKLMASAVNVLRANLRTGDIIARLAEDEFGILLKDLQEPNYAETIASRILEHLKDPFLLNQKRVNVSANIGISIRDARQRSAELLLQEAGIALIQAKQTGQSNYLVYNLCMRDQLIGRMEMESDLRASLDHQQLLLHYQPITEMKTGRLIGFEALVRWQHPQRGMIWPADFIHLSEETGLIIPLGMWVLQEACRQMRVWQNRYPLDPPLMISVNISPRQLDNLDFSEQVGLIIQKTGLPPTCLRLEITESTIVNSTSAVVKSLDALRDLGVQLYIDDFGTGYSSLGYLDSLPVDAIKIDRSFVTNLGRAKSSAGVVQAIIQLAHELNIVVVAEGVETFEQQKELKRMQCEFMQGFYISEPLDILGVERYIAGRPGFVAAAS